MTAIHVPSSLSEWAALYASRAGWSVFPLLPRDKRPATKNGFKDAVRDPGMVLDLWEASGSECNIGLATGAVSGLFVLDVDASAPKGNEPGVSGLEALAALEALHGPLPAGRRVRTSAGGFHLYFRWQDDRPVRNRARIRLPDGRRAGLDARADGGYVVLPPSVHPGYCPVCSTCLRWARGEPICDRGHEVVPGQVARVLYQWGESRELPDPPAWLLDLLDPPREERRVLPFRPLAPSADRYASRALQSACERIAAAGEGERHETLFRESAAIGELVGGGVVSRGEAEAALISAGEATGKSPREVRRAVLDALARGEANPRRPEPTHSAAPPEPPPIDDDYLDGLIEDERDDQPPPAPKSYRESDVGNADRLIDRFGGYLRWCAVMPHDGLLAWDGQRWRVDETKRASQYAQAVALDVVDDAAAAWEKVDRIRAMVAGTAPVEGDPLTLATRLKSAEKRARGLGAWAKASEMAPRLGAMVDVARSRIAVSHAQFDADQWKINTWGGTVDLKSGDVAPHRRDDLLTKITGASVNPATARPPELWLSFLRRIMGGDDEMVLFLQRVCGYCLTGSTAEQCLFLLYGMGANGKSTFLDTLRAVLGDYAAHTRAETLMDKKGGGGIPNDIAALRGARLVTASEPEQADRWSEGLVKEMTGDAAMSARFMRGEFFEFRPTFKVLVAANHKPTVRATDHGFWRRIRLIPFEVQIPDAEKDRELGDKLLADRDNILAWMIGGCEMWQRVGLAPPARVVDATAAYRAEMDVLGTFLAERCVLGAGRMAGNSELYQAFESWCKSSGEFTRSHRWMTRELQQRGYKREGRADLGRRWEGIEVKMEPGVSVWGRG